MIRYPVTPAELDSLIRAESADWPERAQARTAEFRAKGKYEESSSIWSEVKSVYMRLQGEGKCAFCERKLESVATGKVEQDVEHFRPKSNVKAWKPKDSAAPVADAPPKGSGYYLLPYHPFNYAAACKPCNSTLKRDCFPIAGKYDLKGADPAKMKAEKPYLIYPIGDIDEDPEALIEFRGTSPRPAAKSGHARNRALATIEFFQLDDTGERKNLYRDRAVIIMALYTLLLETVAGAAAEKNAASDALKGFLQPRLAHANCAKSFARLFEANPREAREVYDAAVKLVTSIS